MKCPDCGFEIGEKDTICRGCGESVFNIKMRVKDNNITPKVEVKEKVETMQIKTNPSSSLGNENITNIQNLNYNGVSSTSELKKVQSKNETLEKVEVLNNPENDMKCPNCGATIEQNWNFCPSCHNKLNENAIEFKEKYIPSKKEKKIFWMIIICISSPIITCILSMFFSYFMFYLGKNISTVIYSLLTYFTPLCYILALILLIYGKNKYPRNKSLNIMFKIFIILLILVTIFFAIAIPLFIIEFVKICDSMG